MATLSWCVLVLFVIGCQVYNAASALTVTSTPPAGSIAENVAVGTTVVTVSPTGTGITHSLESQAPVTDPKIFAIDTSSGAVSVADKTHLDFEKEHEFTLVIKATATGGNADSGTVTVVVTITKVNEAPRFAEDKYTACVNKSSTGGTVVTQVTATDEDDGDSLTYSITGSSIFEVDPATGAIKVKSGQTVGQTPSSYNLTLTATDDGFLNRFGTTLVSINVADPCPVVTPPNFATTITASFCLFLVSGAMHLLRIL